MEMNYGKSSNYYDKRSLVETYLKFEERKEISNKMRSIRDNIIALRDC